MTFRLAGGSQVHCRISELFALTIHYILIGVCSYSTGCLYSVRCKMDYKMPIRWKNYPSYRVVF